MANKMNLHNRSRHIGLRFCSTWIFLPVPNPQLYRPYSTDGSGYVPRTAQSAIGFSPRPIPFSLLPSRNTQANVSLNSIGVTAARERQMRHTTTPPKASQLCRSAASSFISFALQQPRPSSSTMEMLCIVCAPRNCRFLQLRTASLHWKGRRFLPAR